MKRLNIAISVMLLLAGMIFSGCATVTDSLVGGAVEGLSRAVSERAANAVYSRLAPKEKLPPPATPGWNQFMAIQAQIVFTYSFSPGGLWVSTTGYEPGEYTKFTMEQSDEEPVVIERALLKRTDDGNEWWRVSWSEGEESWVYEGLVNPSDGRLLRLRAKDAEGNEGEVPVSDQTIYSEPSEISEESIEGATVGQESISTPAGTYNTDHVEYMSTTGEGTLDWWITEQVPGGVVKYQLTDAKEGVVWTSTITATGSDATSVLGSF